jgi:hypothetical protein
VGGSAGLPWTMRWASSSAPAQPATSQQAFHPSYASHVTAVHLVERVLPHVPYRQWTLSFPHRVRWVLLKCYRARLLMEICTGWLMGISEDERAWSRLADGAINQREREEDMAVMAVSRGESSRRRRTTGGRPVPAVD